MWYGNSVLTITVTLSCAVTFVECGITLAGVKCGVKECKLGEYCSSFHNTCESCAEICDPKNHNYEATVCEKDCQDYLHDQRYVQKDAQGKDDPELRKTVDRLSRMVTVTLTLVCLMLIVLASFLCFQFYRWKEKKNITLASLKNKFFKKQPSQNNSQNMDVTMENKKPDLRLSMPSGKTISDSSPVTVTTSISRRPAEDSTLDYAYDNPAMNSSPK
nr:unnamed protein product [Callosobruchus chinensis]